MQSAATEVETAAVTAAVLFATCFNVESAASFATEVTAVAVPLGTTFAATVAADSALRFLC